MDSLPIGTTDEELVLGADERKQMVAQHEMLAKKMGAGSCPGRY